MSINSAMLAGVSGLAANSAALAAISDNIANVNTVGYKENDVNFETLVVGQESANTSNGSAGGVLSSNRQLVTGQGTTTQTSSPTDLAISGNGMFVTTTTPSTITPTSQVLYTRAGSFTPDAQGYLKNAAGLYLQGWTADAQGNITPNGSSLGSLSPINVASISGTVTATTAATVNANLDAGGTVSAAATAASTTPVGAGAYNPATNSMTAYNPTTNTGVAPDFKVQVPISDSLGGQHTVQIDFLKSTTANQWYAEIQAVPASDVQSGTGLAAGQIATGIVAFNTDGSLDTAHTTLPTTLTIGASSGTPGAGAVNWATSLGVAAQSVGMNLGAASGTSGLTQFNSTSVVQSINTNGTPFGNLSSVSIDNNGFVDATFDNGTSRKIAQVALATFPNEDGLTTISGDAYLASTSAGNVSLKTAGTGGAGTLTSSALEASTVDLSKEFTNLIITQRAYTASSKVITAADQMTQDLLSIIR
jgi:flagellar hook protein FlgE